MNTRLLIAEDDERIAGVLVRGLREEGYAVEHASDGDAAWLALRCGGWDVVVLDWWLPGQDGLSVLRRFRREDRSTPVLFLTARDGVADRVRGLDAGADDYLCKPFEFEELLARVRALTRRRDAAEGGVLTFRDVRLDLAARQAERAGRPLALTAKEFDLLTLLLRNAGRVVSRTQIYSHLWDEIPQGVSNALEVHVKELRRKMQARGPRLIQTVRGHGYLLGDSPDGSAGEDGP